MDNLGIEYVKQCPFKVVKVVGGEDRYELNWLPEEDNLTVNSHGQLHKYEYGYNIKGADLTNDFIKSIQGDVFKWCTGRIASAFEDLAKGISNVQVKDADSFLQAVDSIPTGYSDETRIILPFKDLMKFRSMNLLQSLETLAADDQRCFMSSRLAHGPKIVAIPRNYISNGMIYSRDLGLVTTAPWFYRKGNSIRFVVYCDIQYPSHAVVLKFD